jgi:hypothetical protein
MFPQTKLAAMTGALVISLAAALPADAAPIAKTFYLDPGLSCQLSIPTIDTAIRPRAIGLRNEGGVTTFVICGLPYYYSGTAPTSFRLVALSFDAAEHTFNCTGVTRFSTGSSPAFSVKSITTPASGAASSAEWTSADLQMGNFDASVTCALPNGAAITSVQIVVNDEIGT